MLAAIQKFESKYAHQRIKLRDT